MMNLHQYRQRGLSLVELMVAMAIGLILLLGLLTLFSRNTTTRAEIERSGRQLENGRYAMQLLAADVGMAGYLGDYSAATAPAVLPTDPCTSALASLQVDYALHVQGYNDSSGGLGCLSDYRGGDVLVVRRAATCSSANPLDAGCAAVAAGQPYVQSSGCSTDAGPFKLDTDVSAMNLRKIGCTNPASIRRMLTHIYYVANNNEAGDGVPTLKRWELGAASNPVPLVEGVENIQFEYGIDADNNGSPDSYSGDPGSVANWFNVVAVKIHLLSRNETPSPGYTDAKFYMLGSTRVPAAGTFGDAYRRNAYSTTVVLENPAGRRQ